MRLSSNFLEKSPGKGGGRLEDKDGLQESALRSRTALFKMFLKNMDLVNTVRLHAAVGEKLLDAVRIKSDFPIYVILKMV